MWERLDFYIEAEYVRDNHQHPDSYYDAWSELGFRPVEWLRIGVSGQRTRIYGGAREIQRGPFVQLTLGPFSIAYAISTNGYDCTGAAVILPAAESPCSASA